MIKNVLSELRKHRKERGSEIPFSNHDEFLVWSDEVSPLLTFDKGINGAFSQRLASAKVTKSLSPVAYKSNVNECIGIVNQAIKKLENGMSVDQSGGRTRTYPHDSIADVFFNSGYKLKLALLSVVFAVFLAGISVGQSKFYSQIVAPLLESLKEPGNGSSK
ncbi:MAG TPA: hypothetical protein V6D19_13640 [Stenomitos sp.]